MPLPLTVSCSSKIQIGFTFLVPAYPGCPGKEAVKWLLFLLLYDPFAPLFLCKRDVIHLKPEAQNVMQLSMLLIVASRILLTL